MVPLIMTTNLTKRHLIMRADLVDTSSSRRPVVTTVDVITTTKATTSNSTRINTTLSSTEDTVDSPTEWATKETTSTNNAVDTLEAWVTHTLCSKEVEITNLVAPIREVSRRMIIKKEKRVVVEIALTTLLCNNSNNNSNNNKPPLINSEVNSPLVFKVRDRNQRHRPVPEVAGLTKLVDGAAVLQAGRVAKRLKCSFHGCRGVNEFFAF
jgi:hypothetical protein